MTVTPASLRTDFPEFTDAVAYPDTTITYWLGIGALLLNSTRWSDMLDYGTELFVAHNLVLERKAALTAANGGVPGLVEGPTASKSVDKVSISYAQTGMDLKAGHWQLTTYGMRFIQLARAVGSGGIQSGPGYAVGYSPGPFSGIWG